MNAYATDFNAIGLPDPSPFDILRKTRVAPAIHKIPVKRGPRKQGKSIVLPGSSKAREVAILRVNPERSHGYTQADADKTARIAGKPNWRRSE